MEQYERWPLLPRPSVPVQPPINDVVFCQAARSWRGKAEVQSRWMRIEFDSRWFALGSDEVRPVEELYCLLESADGREEALGQTLNDQPIKKLCRTRDHAKCRQAAQQPRSLAPSQRCGICKHGATPASSEARFEERTGEIKIFRLGRLFAFDTSGLIGVRVIASSTDRHRGLMKQQTMSTRRPRTAVKITGTPSGGHQLGNPPPAVTIVTRPHSTSPIPAGVSANPSGAHRAGQ
jgi:hypothetical protein